MTEQIKTFEPAEEPPATAAEADLLEVVTLPAPEAAVATAKPIRVDVVGLAVLLLAVGFLWGRAAQMWLWLDEGISVGVASHTLRSIPHVLLQDGSPPLYYFLLHGWTSLFGTSDAATHLLSLLFALATVPAALWAGWSLFGRRTGWMCALVVAINPYVAYYATETRMYSLAVLLAVLASATFLHVFVFGRRRYVLPFAVSLALLLYTHNWGLLLAVAMAVAAVPCLLFRADRRQVVTDALIAFAVVAVLYGPWLPSLLYQVSHHLQPWGRRGDLVWLRDDTARVFGGNDAVVALGLGAGLGLVAVLRRGEHTAQFTAVVALAIMPAVTLLLGWRTSVWAYRYLAVIVAPMVLLLGFGLARIGRAAAVAIGVAAFLSAPLAVKGPDYQKSNAKAVADAMAPTLRPGDLVVLPDLQMVPLVSHYLPAGLRYATSAGAVPDPDVVDWRNSKERLTDRDPAVTLPPLLDSVPAGGHVALMCPPLAGAADPTGLAQIDSRERTTGGGAAGTADLTQTRTTPLPKQVQFHLLIQVRCQQTRDLLGARHDLRLEQVLNGPTGIKYTAVDGRLLTKLPPA